MVKNYLPFARRVYITVPAGARRTTLREQLSSGMGNRTFLSDLAIDFVVPGRDQLTNGYDYTWLTARVLTERCFMRLGIFGRPFLTEDFYPVAVFNDSPLEESGVWRLPKPYTVFPGERLKSKVIYPSGAGEAPFPNEAYDGLWATWPSVAFHGVRQSNNNPIVLYDTFPSTFGQDNVFVNPPLGQPTILQGVRLQCPEDTAVDIYAVKQTPVGGGGFDLDASTVGNNIASVQIYSPDGRKWWEDDRWPAMLMPTFMIKNLRGPEWVLEPDETIQVEFENLEGYAFTSTIMLTLRGQVEVEVDK